jgi:hypothetical protein
MAKRVSDAEWRGDLKDGAGTLRLGSGGNPWPGYTQRRTPWTRGREPC